MKDANTGKTSRQIEIKKETITSKIRRLWFKLLDKSNFWIAVFCVVSFLLVLPENTQYIEAKEGEVALVDYIAPYDVDIPDEETTAQKKKEARDNIPIYYRLDRNLENRIIEKIESFFVAGREWLEEIGHSDVDKEAIQVLRERIVNTISLSGEVLTDELLSFFIEREFDTALEEDLKKLITVIYENGIVSASIWQEKEKKFVLYDSLTGIEKPLEELNKPLVYPVQVGNRIEEELRGWKLSARDRAVLKDFLVSLIEPNVTFDQELTLQREKEAEESVGVVFIKVKKGQVIARRGDLLTKKQVKIIDHIRKRQELNINVMVIIGYLVFIFILALLMSSVKFLPELVGIRRESRVGELVIILLSVVVVIDILQDFMTRFSTFASAEILRPENLVYGLPLFMPGILMSIFYGRRAAFFVSTIFAMFVPVLLREHEFDFFFYLLVGNAAAALMLDTHIFKQRMVIVKAILMVAVLSIIAVVSGTLINLGRGEGLYHTLYYRVGWSVGNALLSGALASFFIPVFEVLLGVTTGMKLLELSNTNLPLLRELAFEAPGTFQHSLVVANLAKAAAEAVGEDPVYSYTAALYHDVGKVVRPSYFIENQRGIRNPHDKLKPSISAMVIVNHVKDGVKLANKYNLPKSIIDVIEQHHGTSLIKYFYEKALKNEEQVEEERFRYPGPKPQNKVAGIIMLADGVEAAFQSLRDPNKQDIDNLVEKIVDNTIKDHQLDETDLTIGDIDKIKNVFKRILEHIRHKRVDYPGFNFKESKSA